jgi:hypothetical protein
MKPLTVVLRSKRRQRALAAQKLQHLVPAMILLGDGLTIMAREPAAGVELAIAVLEIVSGALFVVAAARGLRGAIRSRHAGTPHGHHGVDWVDVFAAGVVAVETIEHYHRTGHIRRPNVLMIVTLLVLAFFHDRVTAFAEHRRALRISDEGLSVGGRPFRRSMKASWSELRSIEIADRFATIETTTGRTKRIDLADLEDRAPVVAALGLARERLVHG